ncbi:MAG: AraC family transcriptional regulator [Clostridia bacterium]|nr:AraC family transcriptional regulator [Clostridia bacterium]
MDRDNICKFNFNRSSDLICLNFVCEKKESQAQLRTAEHYAIHLVFQGRGCLTKNGTEYPLCRGNLFFVCPGDCFSVTSCDGLEYGYVTYRGRRADELALRFGLGQKESFFFECEELIPFWNECQQLADAENIDLVCETVLLYSLAKLNIPKNEVHSVMAQIVELTQKNYTDADLSMARIADELGYNAKYLSSLFKKKKGIAYTQYLREQRIKHAVFLMEQGVVSVKNVALLSGFRDALYFSKTFTASEGVSPKAYIQKLMGASDPPAHS